MLRDGADVLSETMSKTVLEAYGIPVTRPHAARTADEAVEAAERLGYPVVVKIDSPQISHKTEVDGVVLDLPNGRPFARRLCRSPPGPGRCGRKPRSPASPCRR